MVPMPKRIKETKRDFVRKKKKKLETLPLVTKDGRKKSTRFVEKEVKGYWVVVRERKCQKIE